MSILSNLRSIFSNSTHLIDEKGNELSELDLAQHQLKLAKGYTSYIDNCREDIKKAYSEGLEDLNELAKGNKSVEARLEAQKERLESILLHDLSDNVKKRDIALEDLKKAIVTRDELLSAGTKAKVEGQKGKYAATVIYNPNGEILFLRRHPEDDFEPSTLCLPSGSIEEGELPNEAARRELEEETGLVVDEVYSIGVVDNEDAEIHYYQTQMSNEQAAFAFLDIEHSNYEWLSMVDLEKNVSKQQELILDLYTHLIELLYLDETRQAIRTITKAFNQDLITLEQYKEAKDNFEKGRTGTYSDNAQNRLLKRVGQKYGSKAEEEQPKDKQSSKSDSREQKTYTDSELTEYAKNTSQVDLERQIKGSDDPKIRSAAHKEIDRRGKEESIQEDKGGSEEGSDDKKENKSDKLDEKSVRRQMSQIKDKMSEVENRLLPELEGLGILKRAKVKSKDKEYSTLSAMYNSLQSDLVNLLEGKKTQGKIFKDEEENNKKESLEKELKDAPQEKVNQFKIIQKHNPMLDNYHVGIRSPKDIKTFNEVIDDDESFHWGDFSLSDAKKALKAGAVEVYSSKPIEQGGFISTSLAQAKMYSGDGKIHKKKISLDDIAWINGDEGQFASTNKDSSKSNKDKDDNRRQ